jgi:hypothetical protein
MNNFQLVDQEVIRGAIDGVYYGPQSNVLARTGTKLLIWVPGHSSWDGTGRPWRYEPTALYVSMRRDRYKRLSTGGRLVASLKENAKAIDEAFGEGFHQLLEPSKTVVTG